MHVFLQFLGVSDYIISAGILLQMQVEFGV